jgi:hypothetical protein
MQHCVIKFVSDLRQVGGFFRALRFPPTIKVHTHSQKILKPHDLNVLRANKPKDINRKAKNQLWIPMLEGD